MNDLVIKKAKIFITVKAYPKPSGKYEELVCTAGLLNGKDWVRIYPVPFRLLNDHHKYPKYAWIEIDIERRGDKDFRPESFRPLKGIHEEIKVLEKIPPTDGWRQRKEIVLNNVYYSMQELIDEAKGKYKKSLAVFKPSKILQIRSVETDREWPESWQQFLLENDLFEEEGNHIKNPIKKVPYDFIYTFIDNKGRKSMMKIEDWEIGVLYWNCLAKEQGNEKSAVDKVIRKLEDLAKKDLYFFLGTSLQFHSKNAPNPFMIIGLFYPPIDNQYYLF